jgi:hypothetical protein
MSLSDSSLRCSRLQLRLARLNQIFRRLRSSGCISRLVNVYYYDIASWILIYSVNQGRTVQTTLSNLTGLDGLAQERGWRNKVVFSVEISRPGRQGQEAVRLVPILDLSRFYLILTLCAPAVNPSRRHRIFLVSLALPITLCLYSCTACALDTRTQQ